MISKSYLKFKIKKQQKIVESIKESLENANLAKLVAGTNSFGKGMGKQ